MLKILLPGPFLKSRALLSFLAGLAIALLFIGLNLSAYDGFFQDDELETLTWAPSRPARTFVIGLIDPRFQRDNFRPVGHLYFALMGRNFGLDFPPYMTPIFAIHLLNAFLLWLLMRRLGIKDWWAMAAAAFFTLSTTAFDAWWKPMYVYDLLCATFSMASILLYSHHRWVLSFISFWLAYKAKELAVMLPAVLILYEYWFGERKFKVLIPFVLVSLSFGFQGIVLNPIKNQNNAYSFRFSLDALGQTAPFYAHRLLQFRTFRGAGFLLFALAFIRDRRVWFGLLAMTLLMVPLLFLPGRLFEAYTYLPLACVAIAIAAVASQWNPVWAWIALAVWMPFNLRELRHEQRLKLDLDDQVFSFIDTVGKFAARNPSILTFVYDGTPAGFHDWGAAAAWNIVHHQLDLRALYFKWPESAKALAGQTVAFGSWDGRRRQLTIAVRPPGP